MNQNLKPITIYLNGKALKINKIEKCSAIGKIFGLMFKSKNKANALLFEFNEKTTMKIHSFFVFFPFIALWLDGKNQIIEKKIINPFGLSFSPKKPYKQLIEIPLNENYMSLYNAMF